MTNHVTDDTHVPAVSAAPEGPAARVLRDTDPRAVHAAPEGPRVVGQPGTITNPDTTGSVEGTVAAAKDGAVILCRTHEAAKEAEKLLKQAGKTCSVKVDDKIGPLSLWRVQRSPIGG